MPFLVGQVGVEPTVFHKCPIYSRVSSPLDVLTHIKVLRSTNRTFVIKGIFAFPWLRM